MRVFNEGGLSEAQKQAIKQPLSTNCHADMDFDEAEKNFDRFVAENKPLLQSVADRLNRT